MEKRVILVQGDHLEEMVKTVNEDHVVTLGPMVDKVNKDLTENVENEVLRELWDLEV